MLQFFELRPLILKVFLPQGYYNLIINFFLIFHLNTMIFVFFSIKSPEKQELTASCLLS